MKSTLEGGGGEGQAIGQRVQALTTSSLLLATAFTIIAERTMRKFHPQVVVMMGHDALNMQVLSHQ